MNILTEEIVEAAWELVNELELRNELNSLSDRAIAALDSLKQTLIDYEHEKAGR